MWCVPVIVHSYVNPYAYKRFLVCGTGNISILTKMGMKGKMKRRALGFKKGHTHLNQNSKSHTVDMSKRVIRVSKDVYDKVQERVSDISCEIGAAQSNQTKASENAICSGDYLKLRPKATKTYMEIYAQKDDTVGEYMLVHEQKMELFWNAVMREHQQIHPRCKGLVVKDAGRSQKFGTVWTLAAKCTKCNYLSKREKLYDEVLMPGRGRKAAAPNVRLQVALSKNSIGNTAIQHILASMNVDPPSKSGLRKSANSVSDKIKKVNTDNMKCLRDNIKNINSMSGKRSGLIDIEVDGTYNHRFTSSEITPTQPATQATYLCAENVTTDKKIINCRTYNRLCQCDVQEKQGPHTQKCKANLASNAVIGQEKNYLAQTLSDLHREDFSVVYLTMDGDSSARSLVDSLKQPDDDVECNVQYCIRHIGRLFKKKLRDTSFSTTMFPGNTKAEKTEAQKLFALDMANRAQAEFNQIYQSHGRSVPDMINRASYIPDAIIECYSGNHIQCGMHSYVCGNHHLWDRTFIKNKFSQQRFIAPNTEDKIKLHDVLKMRFSRRAVLMSHRNRSQNKCEAANRGLTKAVPKNITYKRNYEGRVHSAVHTMNHSLGQSTVMLAEALGAGYPSKSPAVRSLQALDKDISYHRQRQRSSLTKLARKQRRENNFLQVFDRKASDYNKAAALSEDICPDPKPSTSKDHPYNKPKRRRQLLTA